jgi:DNA-binding SARP family transcriptional activator
MLDSTSMKIRLLGPLEVVADDGAVVELSSRKQQIIVAVLAGHANGPVSDDLLIEALWGPNRPRRADASLRVHIHHVRRALGSTRIRRHAGGYGLRLEPDELDVEQFRAMVAAGRAAMLADEFARARQLFDAALSLWRGSALAGLESTPLLALDLASLEELRLQALEHRYELELALGQHARVVADLRALTGQYPLHEPFRGQLMRALITAGRSAEALEVFDDTRRTLADALGMDPSAPLRDLHLSILRDELLPPPAPRRADPPVPRQLPAGAAGFAGRTASLAILDSMVPAGGDGPTPIAVISGPGGVGKTALAVHWGHRKRDDFPDGQLYANLHGFDPAAAPASPLDVIRGCLEALGVPAQQVPESLEARVNLYRTLLAQRRVLVVLDNAVDADQVRPLLPGSGGCMAVVTSRNQLFGLVAAEGARPIALDPLSTVDCHRMLIHRLGADRVAGEPLATRHIIERCAGLPLALSIVAARLATNPCLSLTVAADELILAPRRLDPFAGDDEATDVRAAFSWSYQILDGEAARLFRLLGLLHVGPDISISAAAHLADRSQPQVRALLAHAVRGHLLIERTPGRYAFHDLVRAYAAELAQALDTAPDRDAALGRLLDYYVHSAQAAATAAKHYVAELGPQAAAPAEEFTDHEAALTWLATERPALVAAVTRAKDSGFFRHARKLARVMQEFLAEHGYWHDLRHVQQLALDAAIEAGDPAARAEAHRGLAQAGLLLGDLGAAERHLRRALDLFQSLDDLVNEAMCVHNLSTVHLYQGRLQKALELERSALDAFRRVANARGETLALNGVGYLLALAGECEQALVYCHQALELNRRTGAWQRESSILDTIGVAYVHLARYELAQDYYRQGLELCRKAGKRHQQAAILAHLGDAHHAASQPEEARIAWQQAVDILEALEPTPRPAYEAYLDLPDVTQLRARLHQPG